MVSSRVITVIPNWNAKEDLKECIESLQQSDWEAHEIVVVDNASTDGSVEFIRAHFPGVQVIALEENLGYAGASNVGIRYALARQADYVFLLNNDTVIPPAVIRRLVNHFERVSDLGILTPKVLYHSHTNILFSLGAKKYPFLPVPLEFGHRWRDSDRFGGIMEFDYVTGCAMLIRTNVFHRVGLFDESFFMYYEDGDFCRRVRDKGFRIQCDGSTKIYHKASISSKKQGNTIVSVRTRNKVWFYRRYPHGPLRILTWMTLWGMAFWYAFAKLAAGNASQSKAYWEGFLSGWREPVPAPQGVDL